MWATLAQELGVPVPHIGKGLGHTSEKTTHYYLAALDNRTVERINPHGVGTGLRAADGPAVRPAECPVPQGTTSVPVPRGQRVVLRKSIFNIPDIAFAHAANPVLT